MEILKNSYYYSKKVFIHIYEWLEQIWRNRATINSKLSLKNISKEDYNYAQKVWNTFNIKILGWYHDFYVQSDTSQLADTFEQFRTLCLNEYKLDPAYFSITPGLPFEACLKMTKNELELLTDIDEV